SFWPQARRARFDLRLHRRLYRDLSVRPRRISRRGVKLAAVLVLRLVGSWTRFDRRIWAVVFRIVPGRIALDRRSVTFTAGRLIGSAMPYLVPVIAALLGNLFNAMMFGIIGAVLSLLFALLLPETAGRKFAVIESKERG